MPQAGNVAAAASAVAATVGLRFFGLIPAFRSSRFALVGGAMAAMGLLSLWLPSNSSGTDMRVPQWVWAMRSCSGQAL